VLLLGARFSQYTGGLRTAVIAPEATVVQVDVQSEEFGRLRRPDLAVVADCREMLAALLEAAGEAVWPAREEWVKALKRSPAQQPDSTGPGISPQELAHTLATVAGDTVTFVADGGETSAWLDAVATTATPGRWITHGYLGLMGEGMPLAVGAQLAEPDARVVCFIGDGAVGFNFAEFDTMVRHDLPIVVVVNNDSQWSMSAHGQDLIWGSDRRVAPQLRTTRYDIAASGFGAHGEHVTDLAELAPALERALAAGRPACVNVETHAEAIPPLTRRLMGGAAHGLVSPEGLARIPYTDALEV